MNSSAKALTGLFLLIVVGTANASLSGDLITYSFTATVNAFGSDYSYNFSDTNTVGAGPEFNQAVADDAFGFDGINFVLDVVPESELINVTFTNNLAFAGSVNIFSDNLFNIDTEITSASITETNPATLSLSAAYDPSSIQTSLLSPISVGPSESLSWTIEYTTAVVPVPAAMWLFISGLLGLVGIARRKKTA